MEDSMAYPLPLFPIPASYKELPPLPKGQMKGGGLFVSSHSTDPTGSISSLSAKES